MKKAMLIAACGVFGLFVFSSSLCANADQEKAFAIGYKPCLLIVNPSGSVLYYGFEELANLALNGTGSPTETYENLTATPLDPSCWTVVFIGDNDTLNAMNDTDKVALKDAYDEGSVIGMSGDATSLRTVLGVNDSSSLNFNDNATQVHFLFTDKDATHEFSTAYTNLLDTIMNVMEWYESWNANLYGSDDFARSYGSTPPSGAWDSDYTKEYKGYLFNGGTAYRLLINAYFLKTKNKDNDWVLFTTAIQTNIIHGSFVTGLYCAPYSKSMGVKAVVKNAGQRAELYEYMPTGTVGSLTQSFSVGTSLHNGKKGISMV